MIGPKDATLLVISAKDAGEEARNALRACATALGHERLPLFATVEEIDDLALFIHEVDPWCVVAIDDVSIASLKSAFPKHASGLAPDAPVDACGYALIAVPGFVSCINNQAEKRVAWSRLQAAKHPVVPW